MEDAHLAITDLFQGQHDRKLDGHSLFAVFDGHGGSSAAQFAARNFAKILLEHKKMEKYMTLIRNPKQQMGKSENATKAAAFLKTAKKALLKEILEDTFVDIDRQFLMVQTGAQKQVIEESNGKKSTRNFKDPGTTALAVLVTPELVVCANAGDCRALLIQDETNESASPSSNGKIASPTKIPNFVELSEDHRPDNKVEERRIKKAGGFVFGGRLEDDLAVSRGFGDYRFKDEHITMHGICQLNKKTPHDQKVSPHPEIKFHTRNSSHKFLFLGCDGVFEQMKSEKVVRVLCRSLEDSGQDLELACTTVRHGASFYSMFFLIRKRTHRSFSLQSCWKRAFEKAVKTT